MGIPGKIVRSAGNTVAVLFIVLSLAGVLGVWWADRLATDIALKTFGLVETGVGIVDAGVARVQNLVTTCRTEVRQASETMTAVGPRAEANTPVLNALNERLETSLSPRIAQMQQVMGPVRDAVAAIANALSVLDSFPGMAERAPRLAAMEDTFNRLEELSADSKQLRSTLRALVAAQTNDLTPETIATLNSLTQRIDTRLGEVQSNVQEAQTDVTALQLRLDTRKSRVLSMFNVLTVVSMLMLAWIIYSQVAVIQRHRR